MNDTRQTPRTFTNPIVSGFHADPGICRAGDDYYLVNSTFEYFPGVPIYHSRDLVHWRCIGHCLTRQSQLDLSRIKSSAGIYAPTIAYHKGTFYMACTVVDGGGNFYVTAKDPAGPWSEPVWLDKPDFDPSLFFDEDGAVYYQRHVGREDGFVGQARLDLKTGKLQGELKEIWRGTGGAWPEGPHIYGINSKYYLLIAEGGTSYDHRVTIARSDSPTGPFVSNPGNPILTHRGNPAHSIQALGHADMVETPDGWWAVVLGIRPQGGHFHHLGRETFLAPVTWNKEGWPVMGNNGTIEPVMDAPKLKPVVWPEEPARDDFDAKELAFKWNYIRNPHPQDYSLTEKPGFLRLKGSALDLNDAFDSPAFVGRRQEHLSCRAATRLFFNPKNENEEAGLVMRGNENNHFEIAVTLRQGKRVIVYRSVLQKQIVEERRFDAPGAEDLILCVEAAPLEYRFSFQSTGGAEQAVGTASTRDLSTEKIGGFTGVYMAMYATGNGKKCRAPADFDWFEYRGREK